MTMHYCPIILASVLLTAMPSCMLQREVVTVQDGGGRPLAGAVVGPQPITLLGPGNESSPTGRLVVAELKGHDAPFKVSKHGYRSEEITWDELGKTEVITLRPEQP